jgi:hypothetical protein
MKRVLISVALVAAMTAPTIVLAQMDPKTTTCADFNTLDVAGQTEAIGAMYKMAPEGAAAQDETYMRNLLDKTAASCLATPDILAMDAMTAVMTQ